MFGLTSRCGPRAPTTFSYWSRWPTRGFGLESGLVAEFEDLYVHPDHRRQGVAARLISDSAEWAQLRGAKHLEVVIAPNGLDVSHLHAYYDKLGFRDEGRTLRTRPLG